MWAPPLGEARRLRRGALRLRSEAHELLTEVLSFEHADEGLRCALEALRDRLAILDASVRDVLREVGQRRRPAVHVLAHDEALEQRAVREQRAEVLHAVRLRR